MTTKTKSIKGETTTGFKYEISESALNNLELLECLVELDENTLVLPKAIKMILGEEQKKALYDHVRLDDGTVPVDKISNEILEIFKAKEVKNS